MEPRPPKASRRTGPNPYQPQQAEAPTAPSYTPPSAPPIAPTQPQPQVQPPLQHQPASPEQAHVQPPSPTPPDNVQPRGLSGSPAQPGYPQRGDTAAYSTQPPAMNPSWVEPPRAAAGAGAPPLTPLPGTRGVGGSRFLPAVISGLVVALLLIGGFIGYKWASGDDNPSQPAGAAQTATQSAALSAPAGTPSPTATVASATATAPAEPSVTSTPEEAEATSTRSSRATRTPTPRSSSSTDIADMLPTEQDVPKGFVQTEDDTFTEQQVADGFTDPADAAAKLDEWSWREGVSRSFEVPPDANPSNDQTTYLYVSIHRFARSSDAADAIGYFSDALAQARDLKEITIDPIGSEVIALSGGDAGSNEVGLYIRDGSRLIRVTAYSVTGEPLDDAIALAQKVLDK